MIDRKSLGNMTLREIKAGCKGNCYRCNWLGQEQCRKLFGSTKPREWKFPLLTDTETKNIKAIHRLIPNSMTIIRAIDGVRVYLSGGNNESFLLDLKEFPSLHFGDEIDINEVLRNEN